MSEPYRSPFEEALRKRGAVFGTVDGVSVALHFGDLRKEGAALRSGVGVVDRPWRGVVEVSGRDRVRFLQGMCTNDVTALKPGEGCMAAVVNRQGKMVAEIIIRATENLLLLELDRSNIGTTLASLNKFIVADDVTMKVSDAEVVSLHGAGAPDLLQAPPLANYHAVMRDGVMISRNGLLGPEGYDLLIPGGRPGELDRILGHGATPAGLDAYETLRIENGFPRWGAEMDGSVLPIEAGLESLAICYTKGCYIGQEVIQRVKTYSEPPRILTSLAIKGIVAPVPGAAITVNGEEIGRVTSATAGAALGLVRKEYKAGGIPVMLHPGIAATTRPLPWQKSV